MSASPSRAFLFVILCGCLLLVVTSESVTTFQGLNDPNAITIDSKGNVFVSDGRGSSRVFKFAPDGSQIGVINDPLTAPWGLAVDAVDNLYVVDFGPPRIVKFNNDGTLSQTFTVNFTMDPRDVAVDSTGNVYVADRLGRVICFFPNGSLAQIINSTNVNGVAVSVGSVAIEPVTDYIYFAANDYQFGTDIRLVAPNGTLLNTILSPYPSPLLAVDRNGYVYMSSYATQQVVKLDSNGTILNSITTSAPIQNSGLCIDLDGNVVVSSQYERSVWRYSMTTGQVVGTMNTSTPNLHGPSTIAVDTLFNMYVYDSQPPRILKLSTNGSLLQTLPCPYFALALLVDDNFNIYISLSTNRIIKLSPDGLQQLGTWNTSMPAISAQGLALDSQQNLYAADRSNSRIVKFAPDGTVLFLYTTLPTLRSPTDVKLDLQGNLYITDTGNNRIVKLNPNGQELMSYYKNPNYMNLASLALDIQAGLFYVSERTLVDQVLDNGTVVLNLTTNQPSFVAAALAVDSMHRVYVADSFNNRILRFNQVPLPPPLLPPVSWSSSDDLYLIIGVVIGGVVFLLIAIIGVIYFYRRLAARTTADSSDGSEFVKFQAYNAASQHPAFL